MLARVAVALFLFALRAPAGGAPEEDAFATGLRAYREGHHREALRAFQELLAQNPDHVEANYYRAMALEKLGALEEARAAFMRTLRIDPGHLAANYNFALVLAKLGEPDASREQLARFQKLSGERERRDSLEVYARRRLERIDALDDGEREDLAVVLLRLGRFEEAIEVTERALKDAGEDYDLEILHGEALEGTARFEEAAAAYGRAVALRPDVCENYWRRSVVELDAGHGEVAERDLRQALTCDASFEPARLALARLLTRTRRADEAVRLLSPSAESPGAKAALAEAYLASRRFDEARALLERAREQDPDNVRVLALLGPVYGRAGKLDDAADALERALALGEQGPELRRNLALVYLRAQKTEDAIVELRLAARDAPKNPSIWFTLGNVYLRTREPALAVEALKKALAIRPMWPEATFNLALALEQSGADSEAADAFRRFLSGPGAADPARRTEAQRRLALLEKR